MSHEVWLMLCFEASDSEVPEGKTKHFDIISLGCFRI